ncbi:MAG: tetratricopeptide repeat protein [Polyangiales bacterium]
MRAPLLAVLVAVAAFHCKGAGNEPSPSPTQPAASAPSASSSTAAAPALPKHSGLAKLHPAPNASVMIAGDTNALPSGAAKASPASVGLVAVDFGPPGPLVIKGYPTPLQTGMRDYVTVVGWSKDGSSAIACGQLTPIGPAKGAELGDTCYFTKGGKTERASVEEGASGPFVGTALAEQLRQLKEGGPTTLKRDDTANTLMPPAVTATWPFAKDLVLSVATLERKDSSTALRIGGSVGSADPVYPVTMVVDGKIPEVVYSGEWNAVMASPGGKELAFVGHFFCAEWCNEIVITRLSYGKLASLVFNDTGFRVHQKKDWAGSRDLFLKATWADPEAPLPPYNLACAYAQLGDATNAEKALKLAIALGGDTVKSRAKKDADFKSVLQAKWFTAATD